MKQPSRYVYLSCMGGLWRMSRPAAAAYLKAVATNQIDLVSLDYCGTFLGYVENVTDITQEEAESLLKDIRAVRCRKDVPS